MGCELVCEYSVCIYTCSVVDCDDVFVVDEVGDDVWC